MRKLIIGSLVAAAFAALPAAARTDVGFYVSVAPPAAPFEVVPAPRAGHVWVPGHWDWRGHRHHWVRGHWIRARHGYHQRAGWRDSDRDGVPNRYDRSPYNPYWR